MQPLEITFPIIIKLMQEALTNPQTAGPLTTEQKKTVRTYFATLHANPEFAKLSEEFFMLEPEAVENYLKAISLKIQKDHENTNHENVTRN